MASESMDDSNARPTIISHSQCHFKRYIKRFHDHYEASQPEEFKNKAGSTQKKEIPSKQTTSKMATV